jgi:hypothetical protein
MRKAIPVVLAMTIAAFGSLLTAAQDMTAPPKVLEIQREFIKPGKAGAIHDKSESNFVAAMARAKWPTHYVALSSMSGKSRALYIVGYDSFAAWQKDNDATEKNAALSAEIDKIAQSDGELLDSFDQGVLYYDADKSYRPISDLSNIRYVEITQFTLQPGHGKDWEDLVKMVIAGHKKAGTNANWATYELEYGGPGDTYLIFSGDTGMKDIDDGFLDGKKFHDAMGDEGMKKLDELYGHTVASSDSELFSINPKQSYPPDAWVKAAPDFWKPKPMAAAKPAADSKPAAAAKPGQ